MDTTHSKRTTPPVSSPRLTPTLMALTLVLLAAFVLSGCPFHPQDGTGYGASRASMMHAPAGGMGDGGQDRLHRPIQ